MKSLSVILVIALMVTSIPYSGKAASADAGEISDAQLKKALAEDKEKYPKGGLEFFESQVVGSEGDKQLELTVVRRGGTEQEATVDFKAVDVSATYGKDYTLSVEESSAVTRVLEKTSGTKALTEYYSSEDNSVVTSSPDDTSEEAKETDPKVTATKTGSKSSLHAARDTYLNQDTDAYDWEKAEGEAKAAAAKVANQGEEAIEQFSQEVEGVGCELTFEEGEYKKVIRIDIVDDKLSETDEQVMFLLSNAAESELASTTTAYLNIKDNDENEKAVFAMDSKSVKVDSSKNAAEITIKRISGKEKIASVIVGTGEQTAKAGEDYVPFKKEVVFAQGVTEQTVEVELLQNGNTDDLTFQVALDAENSYVKESAAMTTVTIKADAEAVKSAKKNSSKSTDDADDSGSAQAASEWNDTKNVNGSAAVWGRQNTWSGRQTFLSNIDLSTADRVDITWKSNEGSRTANEQYKDGCDTKTRSVTYTNRDSFVYINGQTALSHWQSTFNSTTQSVTLNDNMKTTSAYLQVETKTRDNNDSAKTVVSKVVIHYPGYQFTITNTPYEDGDFSNQYIEKIYSADGNQVDASGHRYSAGEEIVLGTAQLSKNGANAYQDSVTLHRSSDTLSVKHSMAKTKNSNGVAVDSSATGNVYLAGYQLQQRGGGWSSLIRPDDLVFSKAFITNYKNYILNGNEIKIRPVYRPYAANIYFQNTASSKGSYNNAFKKDEIFRCTQMDTIELKGIANKGYAIEGFNLGTCYGENTFHKNSSSKNVLAVKGDEYRKQSTNGAKTEVQKYAASNYTKVAVQNQKFNKTLANVITFTPSKEFTYVNMAYTTPKITAKINPLSENQDKGVVVYAPKDSSGNTQTDKVQEGSYQKDLVIEGITINQEYTLNAVTEDGFKALFQDFTGDENGDGKISTEEAKVVDQYNIIRTANNGNAYSFRPVLSNTLIYYAFQKAQENRYAGTLDGVVALKSKPIFGTEETVTPINGAQVSAAGHTTTTKTDSQFGGYNENGGDGYFSISDREFSVGDNVTVNVSYNNLNVSATQAVNAAQKYLIDAYDTIGVSGAKVYQVNGEKVTSILPATISNADKTFRFEIQTVSKNDMLSAKKAIFKFYRQDGTIIDSATKTVNSDNEIFTVDFNPATLMIPAGATMTVQFVDQNGTEYFEHDMGISFAESIGIISFLSSFNFGGAEKALELIGTIDSAFNFGWDGDIDEKSDIVSTSADGNEKTISLGFSFSTDYDSSDEDKEKEEALKDTAKNNSSTTAADKEKQSKAANDSVNKNNSESKSKTEVGVGANFECSFGLKIAMGKSTQTGHKGEWYFKEMVLTATAAGGVTVSASYVTPIGLPIRVCLSTGASGAATFVIEQNYDKDEYYFSNVMDKNAKKVDLFNFNMNNGDRAFDAYGIFNVSPYIDLSAGAGFDFLNLMVGGRADFNMNFYTRSDQTNSGSVNLSAYIKLKVLFFEKKWDLYSKNFNLFGNASSAGYLTSETYLYTSLSEMEVEKTDYLSKRGKWNESSDASAQSVESTSGLKEVTLLTGMYPNADIKIQKFGNDGNLLAVFLDADSSRNTYNQTALYYTIYDSSQSSWGKPGLIENDGTLDSEPCIYDLGNYGIYIAWSTSNRQYTSEPSVLDSVSDMDIHGVFFNPSTKTFGDIQEITQTKPYSYTEGSTTVEDYCGDVSPSIAYNADTNKMMVFYTKSEYEETSGEEGVVGDLANPYSVIAFREYNLETNEWNSTYPAEDGVTEDYTKAWYGQKFLDVEVGISVEEELDESGYWKADPTVEEAESSVVPLIVEKDVVSYNGLAILTYIADYDNDKSTVNDRDVFMQVYNFSENSFTHPIMVTTSKDVGERELSVGYSNGTAIMTYISDGTLYGVNVSNAAKNLKKYTINSKDYYVIDRTMAEADQENVYQPPIKIAGKEAQLSKDTVEVEENTEALTDEDMTISDVNLKSTKNYIYAMWTQTETKVKEGIDETSEEAQEAKNRLVESQIYVMRFDNSTGTMTQPVQVTNGAGCNYSNLDYIVEDGEAGAIKVLGLRAGTTVGETEDASGEAIKYPTIDYDNQTLLELSFTPSSTLTVQDVKVDELTAGTDSPVSITLYNDGLETLTDLTFTATDKDGKQIYTKTISADAENDSDKCVYGGHTVHIDFPLSIGEDETKGSFDYKVVDKNGKVLISDSYEEDIPLEVDVTSFKAKLIDRETAEFAIQVTNNSRCKSGEQSIAVTREYADGQKELVTIPIESLLPGQSTYIEKQYQFGEYANMFTTAISDSEGYIASAKFKAVSSAGTGAETDITLEASKEQRLRMAAVKSVEVVDNSNFAVKVDGVSQLGIKVDSMPYEGSRYDSMDQNDNSSGASGLRVIFKAEDNGVVQMYDNGYYEGLKNGTAKVTAYIMPNNNQVSYNSTEGSLVEDNYTTLPDEMIMKKTFTVTVSKDAAAPTPSTNVNQPSSKPSSTVKPAGNKTSIQFPSKSAKIGVKESIVVTPKLSKNSTDKLKKVTYKASGKAISIRKLSSGKLKVTGKKKGKAYVTVTASSGATAKFTVSVKKAPKFIKAKKKNITLKAGKSAKLKYKLSSGSASYSLKVKSNKKKVVKVLSGNKIKALKKGTATLTLRTYNGKTAKVKVKVKK